mgnify:CR=1 FL=1|tara:strand:+ start:21345 stop:21788 length:444 start_codon:yes stop_codon:yes gene_type:complete
MNHKQNGNMKSTLGLPPVVTYSNAWLNETNKQLFLQKVNARVDQKLGTHVHIQDTSEIFEILKNTVTGREVDENMIDEAVEYTAVMLEGRAKMHVRLHAMSGNTLAASLQPRGRCEREKGCLPMAEVRNSGSMYKKYLENQNRFRDL